MSESAIDQVLRGTVRWCITCTSFVPVSWVEEVQRCDRCGSAAIRMGAAPTGSLAPPKAGSYTLAFTLDERSGDLVPVRVAAPSEEEAPSAAAERVAMQLDAMVRGATPREAQGYPLALVNADVLADASRLLRTLAAGSPSNVSDLHAAIRALRDALQTSAAHRAVTAELGASEWRSMLTRQEHAALSLADDVLPSTPTKEARRTA